MIEIPTLRPLLERNHSEYLINFMYDFILRAHNYEPFNEDMKAIFGEVPVTEEMTPEEKEQILLRKYRERLKSIQPGGGDKPRSAYVAVLDPVKDRTKYHLVYLTQHPLGIKVFMEESEKVDIVQKTVRAKTKQERRVDKSGQEEMFSALIESNNNDDHIEIDEVKSYWLSKLSFEPESFGIIGLVDMLEDTGWFISDFQEAFRELENEGLVKNLDAARKRPVNSVNFNNNERLVKIK